MHAARTPFYGFVVGIGASAGGLDALERLFGALPADTGAAFVVIQHLSPDHKSMMDNLLARYTAMPVRVVEQNMPLEANAVFLIPPATCMRIVGDRLTLSPKAEHGLSLPIDIFFHSLAEQCGERGIAVVLSGTGSDGSRGVPAVNAAGGFVFVQEPASARFDGMPRSAVGTGLVDVVAPAEELAAQLAEQLRAPRGAGLRLPTHAVTSAVSEPLEAILELVLASSGIDFRDYKPTTVLRRIERRMQVQRLPTLASYLERLSQSPDEQRVLQRELLIPVTRFFRDTEVFEQLASQVVPALLGALPASEPIRVWSACCATGEEAYSLAILFAEACRKLGLHRQVKIFATDVESHYLEQGAAGVYPDTIAAEVSGERLERYFVERQGGWAVRPELRQTVIFARHNLVADPPFTRMDLVVCRNALIYLQPAPQERALRRLQYALAPGGHLLLGPSESLGVLHRDFEALPGRHKIYRLLRRDRLALHLDGQSAHRPTSMGRNAARLRAAAGAGPTAPHWVSLGQRQLLNWYTPPSLLVGPARELLHVYGNASELLHIQEGEATLDVLKLLRRELAWPCSLLLQAVAKEGVSQTSAPVTLGSGDTARRLQVVARRLDSRLAGPALPGGLAVQQKAAAEADADNAAAVRDGLIVESGLTLLSFEPLGQQPSAGHEPMLLDEEQRLRVEALERELELTHESLQTTIEELETSNEELQATNEELLASNEELQSTNEELQSVNEELYTVNSEYQQKVDVLNSVNADLENMSKANSLPTVFVDENLHLQRFTPELMQLFKVRDSDRGRSIEDFTHLLDYPDLYSDLRRTLAERVVCERELRSRDGRWWLARMQPYQARGPGGARAVMSFFEVTSLKDSERMQAILDSLPEHVAVLDAKGTIVRVNEAWRRFARDNGDPEMRHCGVGSNYLAVCSNGIDLDDDARTAFNGLNDVLNGRRSSFSMQYPCRLRDRTCWFVMHTAPVAHPGGGAVVSHIDITPWVPETAEPGGVDTAMEASAP